VTKSRHSAPAASTGWPVCRPVLPAGSSQPPILFPYIELARRLTGFRQDDQGDLVRLRALSRTVRPARLRITDINVSPGGCATVFAGHYVSAYHVVKRLPTRR